MIGAAMLCNASSDGVRDDSPAQLMGGSWEYHGTGLSFGRILQTLVGKQFLQMPSGILWCAGTRCQVVRHTTDNSTFIVRHNTDRICSSGASTQREALWDHCVFGSSKKASKVVHDRWWDSARGIWIRSAVMPKTIECSVRTACEDVEDVETITQYL